MLVCQLPAAFRRLPRPSSPVIAKSSATCNSVLDPITLSPQGRPQGLPALVVYFSACVAPIAIELSTAIGDTYNLTPATPQTTSMAWLTSSKLLKNSLDT